MKILHVSCSPRGQAAESYRLARKIVGYVLDGSPSATVIERDVGQSGSFPVDAAYALALGGAAQPAADLVAPAGTLLQSDLLIRELDSADLIVIGTPMHNFTVPAALKAWIDHIVRVHRTFRLSAQGKTGALRDRPVLIAVSSGGRFSEGSSRQPDFLTGYLRAVLATIGLHDVHFFSVQGTALGADVLERSRAGADLALQAHFSSTPALRC